MDARPRSARLIVNPVARHASRLDREGALRRLREWGVEATVVVPGSPADLVASARCAADDGVDLLLVAGGDGTLRLAAGQLAGSRTALAAMPTGTANVWAHEVGIPSRWQSAIDAHVLGQRVAMDLGRAGEEPFLLMAGIGWDAAIAARVRPGLKRRLGPGAYALEALAAIPRFRSQPIDLVIDGVRRHGEWGLIIASNTRLYAGLLKFTPGALADDGLLNLIAIGPRHRGQGVVTALRLLAHRLPGSTAVAVARARSAEILTQGVPFQLDGDTVGETPVRLSVQERALVVSLPAGPLPHIFGQAGFDPPEG